MSSTVAVTPLAVLIGYELVSSKPYKVVGPPLQKSLESAGSWLPFVVLAVAAVIGYFSASRLASGAPILATAAAALVSVATVVAITLIMGQAIPRSGDFGTGSVIRAFTILAVLGGVASLVLAYGMSLLLRSRKGASGTAV